MIVTFVDVLIIFGLSYLSGVLSLIAYFELQEIDHD